MIQLKAAISLVVLLVLGVLTLVGSYVLAKCLQRAALKILYRPR